MFSTHYKSWKCGQYKMCLLCPGHCKLVMKMVLRYKIQRLGRDILEYRLSWSGKKKNITFWCRSIYLAWQLWIIVFQDLQIVKRNPFIPHGLFHSSECSNRQMLSWFNRHSSNIKYNFSFDSLREYLQDVHFLNKSNLIQIIISQ